MHRICSWSVLVLENNFEISGGNNRATVLCAWLARNTLKLISLYSHKLCYITFSR